MFRISEHARRTDTGRRREGNEDASYVRVPLFVIADGMGGARAGEVASRLTIEAFGGGMPAAGGSDEQRLAALIADANTRVLAGAERDPQHAGMGTTCTAAYLGEHALAIAHVGDSRCYRFRGAQLTQLTDDHSLVGELVRRGQISAAEAEDHPQRSIITRALGQETDLVVDHHSWSPQQGDIYLLCSDGLTDMIDDRAITAILAAGGPLGGRADALVAAANRAGGRDNITVILFAVEEIAAAGDAPAGHTTTIDRDELDAARAAAAAPATARAPRAPREAPAPQRVAGRRAKLIVALVMVVLALGVIVSAAWIASRSVYFVGTDSRGFVTLYRGLPYELPLVRLYQAQYVSGLPARLVPPAGRDLLTGHELRSQDDAVDLVRQLEQGTVGTAGRQ